MSLCFNYLFNRFRKLILAQLVERINMNTNLYALLTVMEEAKAIIWARMYVHAVS